MTRVNRLIVEIGVAPLSDKVKALAGKEIDVSETDAYRDMVLDFFRTQGTEYELRAQPCTALQPGPSKMPALTYPRTKALTKCWAKS